MHTPNLEISKIQEFQRNFVKDRDWDQFHSIKNLSIALSVEASELAEIFQWMTDEDSNQVNMIPKKFEDTKDELSDILYYVIRIADKLNINLEESIWNKMKKNSKKYPVELSKGNSKKYNEL